MNESVKALLETPVSPIPLGKEEARDLAVYIEQRTGLTFSPKAVAEMGGKLSDLFGEREIARGETLLDAVRRDEAVLQSVVNRLTVGESYFFRNRPHFEALRRDMLPDIIENNRQWRSLRIWCAGCARGEEPYSLSILLREHFPELTGWGVSIKATDINTDFIELARMGVYNGWSLRGIEPDLLRKYFAKQGDNGYRLRDEIRDSVVFSRSNLGEFPGKAALSDRVFDLVLCRNVLIYFSYERATEIIQALTASLREGGYLLLGHSETVPVPVELDTVHFDATYAYRRVSDAGGPAEREPQRRSAFPIPGTGAVSTMPPPRSAAVPALSEKIPPAPPFGRGRPGRAGERKRRKTPPPLTGSSTDAAMEKARSHADRGEIAAAHEILERLAEKGGVLDHRVHFLHAIVSDQHGKTREAIESLKKSVFLKKSFILGHYYLGVVFEREGDVAAAERHLRNARNLLLKLPEDGPLEEAEGLTCSRLLEIVEARLKEVRLR